MFRVPVRQLIAARVEAALLEAAAAPRDALDGAVAWLGTRPTFPALRAPRIASAVASHGHAHTITHTITFDVTGAAALLDYRPARRPLGHPRARVRVDGHRVIAETTEADAAEVAAEVAAWLDAHVAALDAEVAAAWPDAVARVRSVASSRAVALAWLDGSPRA